MLGGVKLKWTYSANRSCFVYVSSKYDRYKNQSKCVQILHNNKKALFWLVYSINIPEGLILCNAIYSKLLGFEENDLVLIFPYDDVIILDELYIDTDSPEDQEILEHNAEVLQLRILDQLRLVAANQKAIVWLSYSMPIIFTPKKTGILVNNSKLIVKVDAFDNKNNAFEEKTNAKTDIKPKNYLNIGIVNDALLKPFLDVPKQIILRSLLIDDDIEKTIHPYIVFIHEKLFTRHQITLENHLASVTSIPLLTERDKNDESGDVIQGVVDFCVEIAPLNDAKYKKLSGEFYNEFIPTVLISKALNLHLNLENGTKVVIDLLGTVLNEPTEINIGIFSDIEQNETDIVHKFKDFIVNSDKKFIINRDVIYYDKEIFDRHIVFKFSPAKANYAIVTHDIFKNCTINAKQLDKSQLVLPKCPKNNLEYDCRNYCRNINSIEDLVQKIILYLNFEIYRDARYSEISQIKSNVLVTGSDGCGKSSLCNIIQKELTYWSHILPCRSLKGRKDITEVVGKAILICQEHSPAVLICDDFDALVPAENEGASPQDVAYYHRLAVVLKRMLGSCSGICILMTSTRLKSLHPVLRQFKGNPLYTAHFDLKHLDQADREQLFKHLICDRLKEEFIINDDDYKKLAMETREHSIRDMVDLLNKKIFKAVKKRGSNLEEKPRLVEDITQDVDKEKAFDIWGPVGGLAKVKQTLTECIFWPLMYPSLFPSQSCGVLLYGPPGSGKSHIGSQLARLTAMNFILVKGPELLSKYIGQSEKAVRDVFDKAEMKRPCILFFDEFDSLAPRRGADSTGVTDRVVTQLLARLDGAEGGPRAAVLAATSRPDLLDPALLRPARLHTHVYCPLPDEDDRVEIVKIMSEKIPLASDVNIEQIARDTDGYSPADLKSLLVTAQLSRLEKTLNKSEDTTMETVMVFKEDVQSALEETKPSLSKEQRLFYETIYKKFRGESLSPEQRTIASHFVKQKVTLA